MGFAVGLFCLSLPFQTRALRRPRACSSSKNGWIQRKEGSPLLLLSSEPPRPSAAEGLGGSHRRLALSRLHLGLNVYSSLPAPSGAVTGCQADTETRDKRLGTEAPTHVGKTAPCAGAEDSGTPRRGSKTRQEAPDGEAQDRKASTPAEHRGVPGLRGGSASAVCKPRPAPGSWHRAASGQHGPHCPLAQGRPCPLLGLFSPEDPEKQLCAESPPLKGAQAQRGADLPKFPWLLGSSSRAGSRLSQHPPQEEARLLWLMTSSPSSALGYRKRVRILQPRTCSGNPNSQWPDQ